MNPQKNKAKQIAIKNILYRHRDRLLSYKKVKDIGVGYKFINQELTNQLAIIIEVKKKRNLDQLSSKQVLPRQIEGIEVDVIESPSPEKLFLNRQEVHPDILEISDQRNELFEELVGGIWIRNPRRQGSGGTLGAVVHDIKTGETYGITSRHVLFPNHSLILRKEVPIIQPSTRRLRKSKIGYAMLNSHEGPDCIRFRLNDQRPKYEYSHVLGIAGIIQGVESEIICGTKVMKSGARTGVTYGVIVCESICNKGFIVYPDEDYDLIDGELSMPGDSGAIWITNDGNMKAIGLHCLGNKRKYIDAELSMALKMEDVANYLKVRF